MIESKFNLSSENIVLMSPSKDGILFSQRAKNLSAPPEKNRAWTTLNAI